MTKQFAFPTMLVCASALLTTAVPACADEGENGGTSFAIIASSLTTGAKQTAKPNSELLSFDARPVSTIALADDVTPTAPKALGGKEDGAFVKGQQLYGWPEHPGLYCDVLRPHGLGLGAACLQDTHGNGQFDQRVRLSFNSRKSDILVISHTNKIIGARMDGMPEPLPKPIAYTVTKPVSTVTGKLSIMWLPKVDKESGEKVAQIWIATARNFTATAGISHKSVLVKNKSMPIDIEMYGIKMHIDGYDENGWLEYQVVSAQDGSSVPLIFKGRPELQFIYIYL